MAFLKGGVPTAPVDAAQQQKVLSHPIANPGSFLQPGATPPTQSGPPAPVPAPLPSNPTTTGGDTTTGTGTGGDTGSSTDSSSGGSADSGGGSTDTSGTTATTPNEQIGNPSGQVAGLSWAQVENYWIQAGGNPQAASMAAAVADASSGLNAQAQRTNPDGSSSVGLWLIPANGSPPGSTDPLANARAAVQLSQNGQDWTQWCVAWSDNNCGQNNGTYLGSGSNALMSLQGQQPGASYNVFGSTPAGTGVGASSATSAAGTSTPATTSSKLPLLIGGLVIGVIVIVVLVNRKKAGKDSQVQTQVEV